MKKQKRYRDGHFMGIGIAIGILLFMPFGFVFWILIDNPGFIGIGPAIGVAIGISIGSALEKKYNPNPRPPTPEEKRMIKRLTILLIGTFILGLLVFLLQLLRRVYETKIKRQN